MPLQTRFWSPLHLSGAVGPFNAVGDDLMVNPQTLLNPNRGPMLIDQFRFSPMYDETEREPLTDAERELLALAVLAVEIRVGSIPLMSKPVTLGSFVPRYVGAHAPGGPAGIVYSGAQASPYDNIYVWHLDKPLYVPQNVQLTVRIVRQRIFQNGTSPEPTISIKQVRVSVVGRSLPEDEPNPPSVWMPWVSETQGNVASNLFVSNDSDLINSNSVPLHVKQLCSVNLGYVYEQAYEAYRYQPTIDDLRVQMTASNGTVIIRDPTPYTLLFPHDRGLLQLDAILQPGEFFRCGLEIPRTPGFDTTAGHIQFTSVGLTGYRTIPTPRANR